MTAIDFESYYDDDMSITTLGTKRYCQETDAYMVSMYNPELQFCGHPSDAPWEELRGQDVCAHNASFDETLYLALVEKGVVPNVDLTWHCTADACASQQLPRSLKDATAVLYEAKVDKSVRDGMKGRMPKDLTVTENTELVQYAEADAKFCWKLSQDLFRLMKPIEKKLSEHTRMMGRRGVPVDIEQIEESIQVLKGKLWECSRDIPWANTLDAKGKPIPLASPLALARACRDAGIQVPVTTAKNDARFDEWAEQNAAQAPFVAALQRHRALNRALKVLTNMQARTDENERMSYGLKYYGAEATGRWSGDSGLNLQNLPRAALEGVDIRSCIKAPAGKKLIVLDFSQVEARVAMMLGENYVILKQLSDGVDLYEAYARSMLGYTDPRPLKAVDPDLRYKAKTMGLGLQFGLGADSFSKMAKISFEDAEKLVYLFKRGNPGIVKQWNQHEYGFKHQARQSAKFFQIELDSGRIVRYFGPHVTVKGSLKASTKINGPMYTWWGGILFQNSVQGIARDILAQAVLNLEAAGLPVILHVHDEVILEVDEATANESFAKAVEIMSTAPDWAPQIPLAVEGHVLDRYEK
jgi:DNA polymerase I-like protein with 3'-5' exonuclease and polymerase domains